MTATNSTLYGNTSSWGAGAIFNGQSATLTNCTIAGNSASSWAGGIDQDSSTDLPLQHDRRPRKYRTLVSSDLFVRFGGPSAGLYNSLIQNANVGGTIVYNSGYKPGQNPLSGSLGYGGGPTQIIPILPGSPAIDAGSNSYVSGITTDQRGSARIYNGTVDMGATRASPARWWSTTPRTRTTATSPPAI